jgi:hypothetical protein
MGIGAKSAPTTEANGKPFARVVGRTASRRKPGDVGHDRVELVEAQRWNDHDRRAFAFDREVLEELVEP